MENKNERVLAYSKAKTITHDELKKISGGKQELITHTVTDKALIGAGGQPTTKVDYIVDF